MKFDVAKKKLKKLAKGDYHCVEYRLTEHDNGDMETAVGLYIYDVGWFYAPTFAEAFKELEYKLDPQAVATEQLPEVDA